MNRSDVFAEIVGVIGLPAAVKLADARGGTKITIPSRVSASHWLVEIIGREAADQLCAHYRTLAPEGWERGTVLDMPRGPTGTLHQALGRARRQMAEALEAGQTAADAARVSGMTRRTAFRMRRRERDRRQLKLF
ncbi:hypothetical protein [Ancylobacter sp. TS-1]|uniref:hypothetical protein n=1 Tax=Ancylobacter sp. TS-1 TaxID=1850374 RepID=UPI001265C20C|nr:hypothetical protein [Ancylobacter sp. TS-1]QFR32402.1 hypothetical protein GBB76_04320 [Ancylobacter sp. TS-1]